MCILALDHKQAIQQICLNFFKNVRRNRTIGINSKGQLSHKPPRKLGVFAIQQRSLLHCLELDQELYKKLN